jgi:hypothetical protein
MLLGQKASSLNDHKITMEAILTLGKTAVYKIEHCNHRDSTNTTAGNRRIVDIDALNCFQKLVFLVLELNT